ncbi:Arginine N-methyltransferase 2 [Sporothrix epigloea]|uniref:Arginine N-methyltransferase 2 n=1 Tax=Sporothrix epigloea TaxID=1892477 RepID=A0ABP0DZV6_9PEZI
MADIDDSLDARISFGCPVGVQAILRASWRHDVDALKLLLDAPGKASCRDPETGETPLHAATRSMGGRNEDDDKAFPTEIAAIKTIEKLLIGGAIWNDVDDNNETPGCVAWRLNQTGIYEEMVRAGARAEMLFAILGGYEELESDFEEEDYVAEVSDVDADTKMEVKLEAEGDDASAQDLAAVSVDTKEAPYLESRLTLANGKLIDAAGNGVMMDWEADIMSRSVDAMLGPVDAPLANKKRVLNIGFGLGIIDSMIAARKPARHHIIEAHPEVLMRIDAASENPEAAGDDHAANFGAAWEASGEKEGDEGANKVHRGRWQDLCPKLLADGELYDAIYFDTFGEDYSELRRFFTDFIPGLLDDNGVFGFFNGLGADRRVCYDVYTRVVEMHLSEAGLDVVWQDVEVPLKDGLDTAGAGAWEGILRPYWTLDKYRLPICTFMG